jgi:hypothetical protein
MQTGYVVSAILSIVAGGACAAMYYYSQRKEKPKITSAARASEVLAEAYRDLLSALNDLSSIVMEVSFLATGAQPLSDQIRKELSRRTTAVNRIECARGFMFPQTVLDSLVPINSGTASSLGWSEYLDAISTAHHVITHEARRSFVT